MFKTRADAGHVLAIALASFRGSNAFVLGLARGGIIVAHTLASDLSLSFDVLVVKKISSPDNKEFALGAVAPDGIVVIDWRLSQKAGQDEFTMRERILQLSEDVHQKMLLYRKEKKPLHVAGKTIILADDRMATGATMEAAVKWCKAKKAKKIIAAVPVAQPSAIARVAPEVDRVIAVEKPSDFSAVVQFYNDFPQLTDENVIKWLL